MTEKLHCPICTRELDETQSCWIPCEYEVSHASPDYAPLTRVQALQKRLAEKLIKIGLTRLETEKLNDQINYIQRQLKS